MKKLFKKNLYCIIYYGKHNLFSTNGYVDLFSSKSCDLSSLYCTCDLETFYQCFRTNVDFKIHIIKTIGDLE